MKKDYYEILGVSKGAPIEDVKKAYRRLAKKYHPDVAENKKEAEVRMKEINEAYAILSNPQKKQAYDQFGPSAFSQTGGFGQGFEGFGFWPFGEAKTYTYKKGPFTYTYTTTGPGFEDLDWQDFFGEDLFETFFGGFRRPRKGRNLYFSLTIDFMDAINGLTQEVTIGGKRLKVKIPPGVRDGAEIKFRGEGEEGPQGLPPGDLYLTVRVRPHSTFTRIGDDIYVEKEISFVQAALGDAVEVETVDPSTSSGQGAVKLKIPPGTQSGTQFRLRGKGVPHLRGRGRGDQYVRICVKVPEKLSREQKRLLEEFQRLE